MVLINNKKAIGFFIYIALFQILLAYSFIAFVVGGEEGSIFDKEYKLLSEVDNTYHMSKSTDIYIKELISNTVEEVKSDYFDKAIKKNSLSTIGTADYKSCVHSEKNIQIPILYNAIVEDDEKITTNCLETFDKNLIDNIANEAQEKIQNKIDKSFSQLGIDSPEIIVQSDNENLGLKIDIKNSDTKNFLEGSLDFTHDYYESEISLNNYFNLIQNLRDVLYTSSDDFTKISDCKSKIDECVVEKFEELFYSKDSSLNDYFRFEVKRNKNLENEDYLLYDVIVYEIETGEEVIIFSFIIRNNLPLGSVKFSLDNYKAADNVIKVIIEEDGNVDFEEVQYIVLFYSYTDFLSDPDIREDFKSYLQESPGTESFVSDDVNFKSLKYYKMPDHKDSLSEITIGVIPIGSTSKVGDNKREILINQMYIGDNIYELLNTDEGVYVYAFAVDNSFSYSLEEEKLSTKAIKPQTYYSPLAIGMENSEVMSSLDIEENYDTNMVGFQSSIKFKVSNYNQEDFSSYDIYLLEAFNRNEQQIVEGCIGVRDFGCYYFSGQALGIDTENKDSSFLISSDPESKELSDAKEYFYIPSPYEIVDGREYELLVVPINSIGNGHYDISLSKRYEFYEQNKDTVSYYTAREVSSGNRITLSTIIPKDKKAPKLNQLTLDSTFTFEEGNVFVSWSDSLENDIEYLTAKAEVFQVGPQGQTITSVIDNIVITKPVENTNIDLAYNSLYTKVRLFDVLPVDSSGNIADKVDGVGATSTWSIS